MSPGSRASADAAIEDVLATVGLTLDDLARWSHLVPLDAAIDRLLATSASLRRPVWKGWLSAAGAYAALINAALALEPELAGVDALAIADALYCELRLAVARMQARPTLRIIAGDDAS